MREIFSFILTALRPLACSMPTPAAQPQRQQVYHKDQSITWNREKLGQNGMGIFYGQFPFNRNIAPKDFVIKEIGWMTLEPGDAVGMHRHETNEDAYVILSGEGVFVDTDGKEYQVRAGDTTIARKGQSHALRNTGKVPLKFLDIVAE